MSDWADEKAQEAINRTGLGLSGINESVAQAIRQARIDALEEAARVAEGMWWQGHGYLATEPYAAAAQAGNEIAAAIRALAIADRPKT